MAKISFLCVVRCFFIVASGAVSSRMLVDSWRMYAADMLLFVVARVAMGMRSPAAVCCRRKSAASWSSVVTCVGGRAEVGVAGPMKTEDGGNDSLICVGVRLSCRASCQVVLQYRRRCVMPLGRVLKL